MCDQTEVIYSPGDVVWVKLGPVWWPGQVFDYDKLPEEITANLRKKPIAVVKFFQEDSYEYVKNLNSIYHYNCRRKHEFIKKGLDMCRSNNRDVPSNMKMFPNDVVTAEHLTNGNPSILNSKEFAPEEKEDYSELFGKKTPKKGKNDSLKRDSSSLRLKGISESSVKASRHSLPTATVLRPITHPRFITKALEGRSDHEVRIRQQVLPGGSRNSGSSGKQYNCHLCGFSSSRINVIVLHNKSHSAGFAEAYLPPQQQSGKGRKIKTERKMVYSSEKRQRISDIFRSDEPPAKRKSLKQNIEVNSPSCQLPVDKSEVLNEVSSRSTKLKKPVFGRKKSARDKAEKLAKEKQQNDAFRETLLKDWDEDEENEEDNVDVTKEDDTSKERESKSSTVNSSDKDERNLKRKEISCFDFDDSEDGLNIGETVMKFGQKIPRVFGDKPKKQAKNMLEEQVSSESPNDSKMENSGDDFNPEIDSVNQGPLCEHSEKADSVETKEKETEEFHSAFKSLLDETAVPVIPDAPTHFEIKKNIGFETSFHQQDHEGGGGDIDIPDDTANDTSTDNDTHSGNVATSGSPSNIDTKKEVESTAKNQSINEKKSEVNDESFTSYCDGGEVKIVGTESINDEGESKETPYVNTEHFLVKTSEEVATSSSDNSKMEESISPIKSNVALPKPDNNTSSVIKTEAGSSLADMCPEVIQNDPEKEVKGMIEVSKTNSPDSNDLLTKVSDESEINLSTVIKETNKVKMDVDESSFSTLCNATHEDVDQHLSTSDSVQKQQFKEMEKDNFQEMDFDINSMPVIISEDMAQGQENNLISVSSKSESFSMTKVTPVKSNSSSNDSKLVMVKNVTKQMVAESACGSNIQAVLKNEVNPELLPTLHGKDYRTPTRKVLISPSKTITAPHSSQVATIKVQPNSSIATKLTVPGGIISQKNVGSTSQVLILKSSTPGQSGKSTLQKISNTSQMIQQGGKVLILTNPQSGSGQGKVLTSLSTQQKCLSPSKLTGTRILTTKGTVLTTGSSGTVSKANILSSSSKTVTTKSGQKILINKGGVISQAPKSVIINKSGVLTSVNSPTIVSNKPLLTQNFLTSKAELSLTSPLNSSQITVSSKAPTGAILSPAFSANKSMILAPVTSSKGVPLQKGVSLTNNQKLRLITSKASPGTASATSSGAKLMIQSSQSRMILPSSSITKNQQLKLVGNLKGQSSTSTILIQTSQGVIATTPLTSNQLGSKTKVTKSSLPTAVMSAALSPNKTTAIQVAQTLPQTQNKLIVQKVKPAGPNILQKTQKKTIQRSNKRVVSNQLITSVSPTPSIQTTRSSVTASPLSSTAQDTLILSSASGLPVIGQPSVVQATQLDPSNQTALVYLTVDESGNYRPLESTPVVNYEGTASDSQTLYIDPGTADLDNIFLAIDDAGNVVNITQPVQNTFTTESSTPPPSQDILAKALANTQVLQQETIASESLPLTSSVESSVLGGCMFVEPQNQYPQPSLSHSVLETSLTLNQPIMTPLEVPSAVSPRSLDQISSLQTGFLGDTSLLTTDACVNKEKKTNIHPSMPLLSEESDCSSVANVNKNEAVFFTQVGVDGSRTVLTPVTSGSQLFQLALDDSNVIVSSTPGMASLGVITNTSIPQSSLTYIPQSSLPASSNVDDKKPLISMNSQSTSSAVFTNVSQESVIENFQLSEKQTHADTEEVALSDCYSTLKNNIPNDNSVLVLQETSNPSCESFEIKEDSNHGQKDENRSSSINNKVNIIDSVKSSTQDETYLVPVSLSTNNDSSLIICHEVAANKTESSESSDQEVMSLNIPIGSSVDNEQKTDPISTIREESFCAVTEALTETTVINGNGEISQTGKRHLEDFIVPSTNSSSDIEVKKIKLDER